MGLTFRTKLLASHLGLVAAVVLIVILLLNRSLGADLRGQLDERLEQQARGAAQWIGEQTRRHPEKLAPRLALVVHAEVTIFDRDGDIVGESGMPGADAASEPRAPGASTGEANFPEVLAARRGEIGRATRAAGADEMHFVAAPAGDEGLIVRLSVPLSNIHETLASMRQRLIFALGIAGIAALLLGLFAARVASNPLRAMTASATRIAKGDYDIDVASSAPDEFGILSRSLSQLARELKARIGDLTNERDRLSAIFAGMAEGVLVLDAKGTVIAANPAAGQILSLHGAFEGKPLASLAIDPDVRKFIEETVASGRVHETEIQTSRAGERALEIYARPLGESGGIVCVVRDMTRVNRLLTMRKDFVANVSHELRTPVTAIQGYAETLLRGSADPATQRQFLEIMHRQARRLGSLVEGLLRLSELEAKAPEKAVREPVQVAAIAEHVVETMSARAKAAEMRVELDVAKDAVAIGDAGGVEQVIENLVDNALKYGRGTKVAIQSRADGDRVRLAIVDDGPGIEERHLAHLFERFYRVDPSRSRERGGSGLGLAIVKHLVESMGGTVSVESAPGKGATFVVDLPQKA